MRDCFAKEVRQREADEETPQKSRRLVASHCHLPKNWEEVSPFCILVPCVRVGMPDLEINKNRMKTIRKSRKTTKHGRELAKELERLWKKQEISETDTKKLATDTR